MEKEEKYLPAHFLIIEFLKLVQMNLHLSKKKKRNTHKKKKKKKTYMNKQRVFFNVKLMHIIRILEMSFFHLENGYLMAAGVD